MTRCTSLWIAALAATLVVAGCGKKEAANTETTPAPAPSTSTSAPTSETSPYDAGPRASATPVDQAAAQTGAGLFQSKGCTACHAFGKRMTGPDLNGVASRRTQNWLEHWLAAPDQMTKTDPIGHQLFAQYATQMPNLSLTPDQIHALIEFLKEKGH